MELAIPRQVRCIYIYEIAEETPLVHVCCVPPCGVSKQGQY